ncbi:PAS-domain containing protein [Terasakiella sp.]|uniref:PAS-domain containing protein n=1 Tax=Terasakiella sp. TaxID=2034861 RepID=UPI003AFFDE2E
MTSPSLYHLSKEELITRLEALQVECDQLRLKSLSQQAGLMFGEAVEQISEAVVIYGKDGGLLAWNQNFADLYGYTPEDLKPGIHFSELGRIDLERGNVAVGDEYGGGQEYLKRKAEYRTKLEGSFVVRLKDGRWIKTTDRPMGNGGFVSVQVDVTELKKLEERMRYMAQHDMLTQIPNRNLLVEKGHLFWQQRNVAMKNVPFYLLILMTLKR